MVDTYLEHGPILELVATIVAILVAPNFRADMAGALEKDKTPARNRITDGAKEHDSDLLHLVSIFKKWCNSGRIDSTTSICRIFHMRSTKEDSCTSCQAAYNRMYLLNNRSLCIAENVYDITITIVKNSRWQLTPESLTDPKENDIIGANLFKHFPKRYGHLLEKRTPEKDAIGLMQKYPPIFFLFYVSSFY